MVHVYILTRWVSQFLCISSSLNQWISLDFSLNRFTERKILIPTTHPLFHAVCNSKGECHPKTCQPASDYIWRDSWSSQASWKALFWGGSSCQAASGHQPSRTCPCTVLIPEPKFSCHYLVEVRFTIPENSGFCHSSSSFATKPCYHVSHAMITFSVTFQRGRSGHVCCGQKLQGGHLSEVVLETMVELRQPLCINQRTGSLREQAISALHLLLRNHWTGHSAEQCGLFLRPERSLYHSVVWVASSKMFQNL